MNNFADFSRKLSDVLKKKLHEDCKSGNLDGVKSNLLVLVGSDDHRGIKLAIENHHVLVVEHLLNISKDKNIYGNIWSSVAKLLPEDPIVQLVIKKENNINSGLDSACVNHNIPLIDYLISKGANNFQRALNVSARGGHLDLVKKFLAIDPNLNIEEAALWSAFQEQSIDVVMYFESLKPGSSIKSFMTVLQNM